MASITITKDYFDTLIRRAELHLASDDDITIPRSEYVALHQFHREYTSLRAALLAGGATIETLDVLINTSATALVKDRAKDPRSFYAPNGDQLSVEARAFVPATQLLQECPPRSSMNGNWRTDPLPVTADPSPTSASPESYGFDNQKSSVTSSEEAAVVEICEEKQEQEFESNHENRSLIIKGLSNRTTLVDITKVVRGGAILNLSMLNHDRHALVSFVDPIAAEKFLIFSKRTDIYIRGKQTSTRSFALMNEQVEVFWADRQRYMPGHIERKIVRFGASRNLVIRFPKEGMTPENVRDDLEHIDRLELVEIRMLEGRHLLVCTNDIGLAVVARTCMCSRLIYKGSRVDFFPDECGEPLPQVVQRPRGVEVQCPSPKKSFNSLNRFQLLQLASMEEEEG